MPQFTELRLLPTAVLGVALAVACRAPASAEEPGLSIADQRLELMRLRAQAILFRAADPDFPKQLEPEPLFRYDDLTRGYVDGTVWRLGEEGRPLGIITAELHPQYLGQPCIVYDLLSFSPRPFLASSEDFKWNPSGSMLDVLSVPDGPKPGESETQRMLQMKKLMRRFSATQDVEGELVQLRLLPKPIDRYQPADHALSDATIFLFVNGRNPGLLVLLECDGENWQFAIARLSHPSVLAVSLDGKVVWQVPHATLGSSKPYNATNASASIPGYEAKE